MGTVPFMILAGAMLVAPLLIGMPAAAAVASPFHYKEFAQGADVVFSPNCPFDSVPAAGTICDTYTVWYVRFAVAVDGGAIAESSAPFHAEIDHETDLVLHPDGSGETIAFEFGVAPVAGSYDKAHLSQAQMGAVAVPLSDVNLDTGASTPNGRTAQLGPFTWTAASGTYEYGNDGPAFAGGPRHLSTRCETTNNLAHQKDTVGYVTGSLDGTSIASDYPTGADPRLATGRRYRLHLQQLVPHRRRHPVLIHDPFPETIVGHHTPATALP